MLTRACLLAGVLCVVCTTAFAQRQSPAADPFGGPPARSVVVSNARVPSAVPNVSMEQRIKEELSKQTDLEFVEQPLKDALTFIADKHKLDIQYDMIALRDAAIDPTAMPVSLNVHGITLRSALNLILKQNGLGLILEDEVLQITTKDKVNSTLVMRAYDVRDLAEGDSMNQLIEILSSTPKGMAEIGVIKPFKTSGMSAIYVSKPVAVHEEIEQALAELRKLKSPKQ